MTKASATRQSNGTKVSIAANLVILLATLGAMPPPVPGGSSSGVDEAPDAVNADSPAKPNPSHSSPAKMGLLLNDSRAYHGYTLIAPMFSKTTYLIDMDGHVVQTWESDYTPAMSAYLLDNGHLLRPGTQRPTPSGFGPGAGGLVQEFDWNGRLVWDFKHVDYQHMPHHDVAKLPNGNVLLIVWETKSRDQVIAAGRWPDFVSVMGLHADSLIEVKPTGKTTGEIVWEWHVWDHLVQEHDRSKPSYANVSDHPELIDLNFATGDGPIAAMMATSDGIAMLRSLGYLGSSPAPSARPQAGETAKSEPEPDRKPPSGSGDSSRPAPFQGRPDTNPDWTHFNAVAYDPELDQIVVSVHAFSEIWIIDHSTTTAEAASHKGGKSGKGGDLLYRWGNPRAYRNGSKMDQRLFNQHNAHWITPGPDGERHMLVFNNGSGRPGGDSSSVDEIVLPVDSQGNYAHNPRGPFGPTEPDWTYSPPKKSSFYSFLISGAQRLPNGNTLICSGVNGLVFELTSGEEVVWKYANPVVGNPDDFSGFRAIPSAGKSRPPGGFVRPQPRAKGAQPLVPGRPPQKAKGTPKHNAPDGPWRGMMGNTLFRAYRYGPGFPGLAGKNLKPGKTIEEIEALKEANESPRSGQAIKAEDTAKK